MEFRIRFGKRLPENRIRRGRRRRKWGIRIQPGEMIGGQETIAHLRDLNPKIKAIVSSGYATDRIMADYERYGFSGVLSKPYKIDELNEAIHKALEGM